MGFAADAAARAERLAGIAEAHLERYADDNGGIELLETVVANLRAALDAAPQHPSRLDWQRVLVLAHEERAAVLGSLDDAGEAVEWALRLLEDPTLPDEDRPLATCVILDQLWEERQLQVVQRGEDAEALDEVVECFAALQLHGDSDEAAYTRLMSGLARLERYAETDRREDLDVGIELLGGALASLPSPTPRLVPAASQLTNAYYARYLEDHDAGSLDLAIDTGEWALAELAGTDESPGMLHIDLGRAYRSAWRERQRPDELDRAVDCWRAEWQVNDANAWVAANLGQCLRWRADLHEDLADLREAMPLLRFAAEDEDDLRYDHLCELGSALHSSWRLAATPGSLPAALDAFDLALTIGVPDGIQRLFAVTNRAGAGKDLLTQDRAAAARQRANLISAAEVLTRAPDLPDGATGHFAMLLAMAEATLWTTDVDIDVDTPRFRRVLDLAMVDEAEFPEWPPFRDACDGMLRYVEQAGTTDIAADMGVAALLRALASPRLTDATRTHVQHFLRFATLARGARSGDRRTLRTGRQAADPDATGASTDGMLQLQRAMHDFVERLDLSALTASVEEITAAVPATSASTPADDSLRMMLALAQTVTGVPAADLRSLGPVPGLTGRLEALPAMLAANVDVVAALKAEDPVALRRCGAEFAALSELTSHEVHRMANLAGAAYTQILAGRLDPRPETAAAAVRHIAAALDMTGGEQHPLWATWAMWQAEALRLTDPQDLAGARAIGLRALRSQALRVLSQSGTDHATAAARRASDVALAVARWCLTDGDLGSAMAALDAGRGLMLWSATASREIPDQLVAAGRPDLAAEWLATHGLGRDQRTGRSLVEHGDAGEIPDDLRQRVVSALLAGSVGPLQSVPLAEVCAAMSTLDVDALVYLVPGDGSAPGTALVVEASGAMVALTLPALRLDDDSPATGHLDQAAHRDIGPAWTGPAADLDGLCRWAWTAAMRDLVAHTAGWRRPARLVLVPMGALGRVPWHAARHGDRYAVHDVVVSYNVSARMLRAAAAHPAGAAPAAPAAPRSVLVVGDPGGDLPYAGIEARAVHRRFYPDGAYYGSGAQHPGTPEEVLAWIAGAGPGPTLLSFACHGWADPGSPADTHLVLAGGTLAVRRILETSRLASLDIDRVFLAACATNAGGDDHDEACSLAAAFLTAGAHTAYGSLWPVPDRATSVLMYMVHHHLEVDGCTPADALHRAQLWMLDPRRRAPDGMPAELRDGCADDAIADPSSWAAFTHMGR